RGGRHDRSSARERAVCHGSRSPLRGRSSFRARRFGGCMGACRHERNSLLTDTPQTWHYGLVAKWWSEFNTGGPEIDYYRRFIEDGGEPALDVACGTGRLLLPWLRSGLDVDGCDVSADMIALCREQATRDGLSPTLFVQAMHELDPPRSYRTIFVCGAFGLGSDRRRDLEALRRFHEH